MYNPYSLSGKKILVTGASSGIGRSIAIECSKMGANVVLTARSLERLKETQLMMDNHSQHSVIAADLMEQTSIDFLVESITEQLDGIVQCAGFTNPKPFMFISQKNMCDVMRVNFEAPAILTQRLLKKKKVNKGASIVFISSISGVYVSSVSGALYSASKGAINGIVKAMAIELASKSLRVNCVNPGMIDTGIFKNGVITKEQLQEDMEKYPMKRYGNPEEVALAVVYLLSDATKWMTGTNILIDGGYTLL
jgi:NAD(P)-dependent dehydrogenase (short-subunit alcohol dehydrogenase family)